MIDDIRNWLVVIITILVSIVLLGLIGRIITLDKKVEELEQRYSMILEEYESLCRIDGGWNCE